jgi:hypothetical protein
MRPHVTLRAPDGGLHHLGHGDIIGRLWTAALTLDDARVSEAHAMVSLRGDTLRLLGLRGRFAVKGRPVSDVELRPGLRIALARGLELVVETVVLPDKVLAISAPGVGQRVLAGVCSVVVGPPPALLPGFQRGAAAHIWSTGEGWSVQKAGEPAQAIVPGDAFEAAGLRWSIRGLSLSAASPDATRARGGVHAPIRIVASYDTVHIHRAGEPTVALGGLPARILSELVAFDGPAPWAVVAGEIWRDLGDRHQLRRKWDVSLARLRAKLRGARLRDDLVCSDGKGNFELLLHPGDRVEDRT